MTTQLAVWIAGIFLSTFAVNLTILRLALVDKFEHPIRNAGIINLLLALPLGIIVFFIGGLAFTAGVIVLCSIFLLGIIYILKIRDVRGIRFGENLLEVFHRTDLQICYVLHELQREQRTMDIGSSIENALSYALTEIERFLRRDGIRYSNLSVLEAIENGRFQVVAQLGIPNHVRLEMERLFRYGNDNPTGIAGLAAAKKDPICIPDLSDENDVNLRYWVRTDSDEKREGSIICYPIFWGVGDQERILGVIAVSCAQKNAFHCESVIELLRRFSPKIESLIYCTKLIREH